MRVAIVHEWLVDYSGSERVLEQMLECYPDADLYSLVDFLPESDRFFLRGRAPHTTFIQKLPFARKRFRTYLPIFPLAIEQLELDRYDVVISNSHAVAKGVLTGPDQIHLSYCHSPMRYAWDMQNAYLREKGTGDGISSYPARYMLHKLRQWDRASSVGVDAFAANSEFIRRRIRRTYRREAEVIYPPVDVSRFALCAKKEDFYLTVSRFVPYKHIRTIVEAFKLLPQYKLVVIGDGPERERIRASARGAENIALLGYQTQSAVIDYMQRAKAFVFAALEDFGITPLEASACGTPVIAFARGGTLETVSDLQLQTPTGVLFERQDADAIASAIKRFEQDGHVIQPEICRARAMKFSPERFRCEFKSFVERTVNSTLQKRTL